MALREMESSLFEPQQVTPPAPEEVDPEEIKQMLRFLKDGTHPDPKYGTVRGNQLVLGAQAEEPEKPMLTVIENRKPGILQRIFSRKDAPISSPAAGTSR